VSIVHFSEITKNHSYLGGKGYVLGLLKNNKLPVPDGLILTSIPNLEEFEKIIHWWELQNRPKLAIRSSSTQEDSKEFSFAGQNSTFLNVNNRMDIKKSIELCFESVNKKASAMYRDHFLKDNAHNVSMNVVVQTMVDPKYSGVFFSKDPRTNHEGWILEAVSGLGESLVSGKVTPWHFEENKIHTTQLFNIEDIVKNALSVKEILGEEIDMEWAIDKNNHFFVLQARPITALHGKSEEKRYIENELRRLKEKYSPETLWDGQTFSEWGGPPTELTFSLWAHAFSKNHSFSLAMKKLGYLGIENDITNENHSLLERIFDRAYVNISTLAPLYFGPMPYRMIFENGPKLKFDWRKLNLNCILLTPITIWRMLKVSWRLSTQRKNWLNECRIELQKFNQKHIKNLDSSFYSSLTDEELFNEFKNKTENFYSKDLIWPLVLISLIESTTQSLKGILKGVLKKEEIQLTLNEWLKKGLHTVSMDLNLAFKKASENQELQNSFFNHYGHRGPGELELSHPRFVEIKEKAFSKNQTSIPLSQIEPEPFNIELEIKKLKTLKGPVIINEWLLLKEMLELREQFKMSLLIPYAHIRFLTLEIAKRFQISNELIFWLSDQEILEKNFDVSLASERLNRCNKAKGLYLPTIIELSRLKDILETKDLPGVKTFQGESLSSGIVFGEVRIVLNPENVVTDNWPENTILVAESTDPGWTGLFLKSKGIIVEKGGVLSHCAIVAREMNLPAISGIKQCHFKLKDGDKLWLDGNNGRITLA